MAIGDSLFLSYKIANFIRCTVIHAQTKNEYNIKNSLPLIAVSAYDGCHFELVCKKMKIYENICRIQMIKIGTHCVHMASQEKHQHRVFKQNETIRCNIIYISYNAYNAITRSEIHSTIIIT